MSKWLNHHTIAIVHAPSKHFYYIDSLKPKNETMFEKFKIFMEKNVETSKDWTYQCVKHRYQKDSHSCGLKVIMHLKKYFENKKFFNKEKDEKKERHELVQIILNSSERINCLECNAEKSESEAFVCQKCKRFIHLNCITDHSTNKLMCSNCQIYYK